MFKILDLRLLIEMLLRSQEMEIKIINQEFEI
jgi:hypothetical protein